MTPEDECLLEQLRELKAGVEAGLMSECDYGICRHVGPAYLRLRQLWERWPEYSGERNFPVPDNAEEFGRDAELSYVLCSDLFSAEHEYGRARRRLLDFLISELEKVNDRPT